MKNKYVVSFIFLILSITLYILYVWLHVLPFDIKHIVYICQTYAHYAMTFFSTVLIGGLFFVFIRLAFVLIKSHMFLRHTSFAPIPQKLLPLIQTYKLEKKVMVIRSSSALAFCAGIFYSKIYISTRTISLMSRDELKAIILHEKYHLQSNDNLILFLLNIFSFIFFPFPILNDIKHHFEITEEIHADTHAYNVLKNKKPIISALTKMIPNGVHPNHYGFSFSAYQGVEHRIETLVGNKHSIPLFDINNSIITMISLLLLSTLLFVPVSKAEVRVNNQSYVIVCYQQASCDNICRNQAVVSYNK